MRERERERERRLVCDIAFYDACIYWVIENFKVFFFNKFKVSQAIYIHFKLLECIQRHRVNVSVMNTARALMGLMFMIISATMEERLFIRPWGTPSYIMLKW